MQGVRQQLVDQIAAANPFDVPVSWVNQLIDGYLQAYQVPEDQREQFRGEFRPVAERQVRRDLIIETIAERESLKASESDIDDRVSEVASKRGADPGQVYASLQKAGTSARDRAKHYRGQGLQVVARTKRGWLNCY
jgi:trigger factor